MQDYSIFEHNGVKYNLIDRYDDDTNIYHLDVYDLENNYIGEIYDLSLPDMDYDLYEEELFVTKVHNWLSDNL
jgi:tRNA A37 threonylcarbamoyladenosine biosynthesis protein TsaE